MGNVNFSTVRTYQFPIGDLFYTVRSPEKGQPTHGLASSGFDRSRLGARLPSDTDRRGGEKGLVQQGDADQAGEPESFFHGVLW